MLVEGEDSVSGTAHCLLTPYWREKYGIAPGQEVNAKQVSARGGNIQAIWDDGQRNGEVAWARNHFCNWPTSDRDPSGYLSIHCTKTCNWRGPMGSARQVGHWVAASHRPSQDSL